MQEMQELTLKQYVVDAFTDRVFAGNPAAVCVLEQWLPDELMLAIAKENNLSETAFTVKNGSGYELRWFTPGGEIDLCGHATLATAYVLLNFYEKTWDSVSFSTQSGALGVDKKGELYEMDFPVYSLKPVPVTEEMALALGARPSGAYMGRDLLCVFDDASVVKELKPNMEALKAMDGLLLHATSASDSEEFDCISRSFAPKLDVVEDPVCGSGHCHIIPYWSEKLGKEQLTAYQASARGGTLYCRKDGDRIIMAGKAALYSQAEIHIPADGLDA